MAALDPQREEALRLAARTDSRLGRLLTELFGEIDRLRAEAAPAVAPASPALTPRMYDAILGAANGETYAATARRLGRSAETVRAHRHRTFQRLGVSGAAQAVAVLMATGAIRPEQIRMPGGGDQP
jgi:DNA-binding CsgD family transcriptional regulator